MTKLSRTIFRSILLASTAALALALTLTVGILYANFSRQYLDSLRNEAECLREGIRLGGTDYLDALRLKHRVTLVGADGTVLYDSVRDASSLENHLDREEIAEALATGVGDSERYSSTLSEKSVNAALLLADGTVLRVSDSQRTRLATLAGIAGSLLLVAAVAIVGSMLLALRLSRAITRPLNLLDPERPEQAALYPELQPLAERIRAQNEQLARQMEDLRAEHQHQDAIRREFTANVSHELKTPLTSISGYAELIQTGIARPEDVRGFAGKICEESQRLITLVGDIILLSQLDGKEIPVRVEEIDLYETCQAVLSHLDMAAKEKNVSTSLTGKHLHLHAAEQIVEEIIFNLCDNAVKYNKPGGQVEVSLRQCVDGIELTVRDTGIGISPEDQGRIFERFYRVDKSHSRELGGTGLGLSIVKHGAAFLGASVSVESALGKGTTVRVLF